MTDIAANLQRVRNAMAEAAIRAGRSPDDVTLVAVSKTVPAERVRAAVAAGQRVFGENRVQEALPKIAALADLAPPLDWHLIGHLQTNKARQATEAFSLIESLDSVRLAQRLEEVAARTGRIVPLLIEINVAGEASKSGFAVADVCDTMPALLALPHLRFRGLMTVAPLAAPEEIRPVFRCLRELRDGLRERFSIPDFEELSMGMSNDFPVAIEEGATMVRVGRALFGERPREVQ